MRNAATWCCCTPARSRSPASPPPPARWPSAGADRLLPFADSVADRARRLAWPLAVSLLLHAALVAGWRSAFFYASIGHHPDAIQARITAVAPPAPAAPLAAEEQPPRPDLPVLSDLPELASAAAATPTPPAPLVADEQRPTPALPELPPPSAAPKSVPEALPEPPVASGPEYRPSETDASAYLKAGALDEPPIPIGIIEPEYPEDRQGQQPEGRVVLRVLINEEGRVDRVILEEAAAGLRQFGASATDAFLAARFRPARKDGLPVKSQLLVEVQYAHEK